METIKATRLDFVDLEYEQQELNEEIANSKGFDKVCSACKKGIRFLEKTKWLRVLELCDGEFYYSDSEFQINGVYEMGIVPVCDSCYKKYKSSESEINL